MFLVVLEAGTSKITCPHEKMPEESCSVSMMAPCCCLLTWQKEEWKERFPIMFQPF